MSRRDELLGMLEDEEPSIEDEIAQQLSGEEFVEGLDPVEEPTCVVDESKQIEELFENQEEARERFEEACLDAIGESVADELLTQEELERGPEMEEESAQDAEAQGLQGSLFDLRPAWTEYWIGMPEFEHGDLTPHRSIIVHVAGPSELRQLEEALGATFTPKTKSVWFPEADIWTFKDTRYTTDES